MKKNRKKGRDILLTIDVINSKISSKSRLIALEYAESVIYNGRVRRRVKCRCTCGKFVVVTVSRLVYENQTYSCGCWNMQQLHKKRSIHDFHRSLYKVHNGMMRRCYDPRDKEYHNYGGRGVTVCEQWKGKLSAFIVFAQWAVENGWELGLQLDKDIKGNGLLYSPQTCCFVTPKVNANNRRVTPKYLYNGELKTLSEVGDVHPVAYKTLWARMKSGYSFEAAVDLNFKRAATKKKQVINSKK